MGFFGITLVRDAAGLKELRAQQAQALVEPQGKHRPPKLRVMLADCLYWLSEEGLF